MNAFSFTLAEAREAIVAKQKEVEAEMAIAQRLQDIVDKNRKRWEANPDLTVGDILGITQ